MHTNTRTQTHTFYLDEYNGEVVAFMMAQFEASDLGDATVDVVVAISMDSGDIIQTKAGDDYFSFWEKLGTTSTDTADSIFKVQHYVENTAGIKEEKVNGEKLELNNTDADGTTEGGSAEQWHGNGVARWTMNDGTKIMAITHKNLCEAILVSDPWEVADSQILQRFGTPSQSGTAHTFGLDSSENSFTGMHNVFYGMAPDGRESATVFVNGIQGSSYSWVYEFGVCARVYIHACAVS